MDMKTEGKRKTVIPKAFLLVTEFEINRDPLINPVHPTNTAPPTA